MALRITCIIAVAFLLSCRGEKDAVYHWQGEGESRTLTLLKNGTFILDIKAGYYNRLDTGTYKLNGDTLIINPDKTKSTIDSVATTDSLFNGQRYMEVFEEEVVFNTENSVQESFYHETVFPAVIVNDSLALTLNPDDHAYHKLAIPENVTVRSARVTISEDNTCKPSLTFHINLSEKSSANSYRIYIRSKDNKDNYLAGFKWLMRGNTVESFFKNEACEPAEIRMIRK